MIPDRIKNYIQEDLSTDCWNWTSALDEEGYALVWWEGGSKRVSRLLWKLNKGFISSRTELHHKCENRKCVNFEDHLEPVPKRQHIKSFHKKEKKTHCKKGHKLLGDNLVFYNGKKVCATCNRARANKYYLRKKLAIIQ